MSGTMIRNVTVIDGTGRTPQVGVTVTAAEGRITSVGQAPDIATDVEVDGTGCYLIPGLWETEGHLTRYSNAVPADMSLAWPDGGQIARVHDNLRCYLANGVTTVVDLGGPPETLVDVRDAQAHGDVVGARLMIVGRQFTARGGQPIMNGATIASVTVQVDDAAEARKLVDQAVSEYGIDAIKANYTVGGGPFPVAPLLSRDVLNALVDAGRAHGLPVLVHIDAAGAALDALDAGVDNIEHMFLPDPSLDGEDILEVAQRCAELGAYWPFTLALWETLTRAGDERLLNAMDVDRTVPGYVLNELRTDETSIWRRCPPALREHYQARFDAGMKYVVAAHELGVKMTVATDAGNPAVFHGPSARRELVLMVQAGLAPMDALIAGTRMAAEKFRRANDLGTIEAGKIADLVLLNANPLEDINHLGDIRAVIQAGRVHRPSDLIGIS